MDFRDYLKSKRSEGAFTVHNAGDTTGFRYPHLEHLSHDFRYVTDLSYWAADPEAGSEALHAAIRGFAAEDITVWEFLSPAARRIHLFDMTGASYGDELRQQAFTEVKSMYEHRESRFPQSEFHEVRLSDLAVRSGFEYVMELYDDIRDVPIRMLTLKDVPMFPFGSVLKGTDIVITDGRPLNFGQDMLHALYHIKEGIPGMHGNNCDVEETWAAVPALYALQLAEGRMSRRRRLKPSPHLIRFTDYIYLRAYLGQAFAPDGCGAMHASYSIIEPSVRIMISSLANKTEYDRNRILAQAVLEDKTDELIDCFERRYGNGSFSEIYGTWSLYDKYDLALKYISKKELDEIMFEGRDLLPSQVAMELVRTIWLDKEKRNENIALLSSGK